MDRTTAANYVLNTAGNRVFANKSALGGIPGTQVSAIDLTAHQEEIMAVIVAAGVVPSAANLAQLLQALRLLFGTGLLLNIQTFKTVGTATYTPTPGTNSVIVEMQAGGGAGGGAVVNASGFCSAGVPGTSGAFARARIVGGIAATSVTIGAGGLGVNGAAGNNGGDSSFGASLVAHGGIGGTPGISQNGSASGGNGNLVSATGGTLYNRLGLSPQFSYAQSGSQLGQGGAGGPSHFGDGGIGTPVNLNGQSAVNYGSGGGGTAGSGNTVALTGGNGAPGCGFVYEFS